MLSDVHGRRWSKKDPAEVNGQDDFHGSHLKSTINTKLTLGTIFSETEGKTPLDFFHHLFLTKDMWGEIVKATNVNLAVKNKPLLNIKEFIKWLGLVLTMSQTRISGPIQNYFGSGFLKDTSIAKGNFSMLYGMTEARFTLIRECLCFNTPRAAGINVADVSLILFAFVRLFHC